MDLVEIVILLAGAVVFIVSFFIPEKKGKGGIENSTLAREEIKTMVSKEMNEIKGHVDEVVDEAVGYAVEKTERSLERLTNEKIMAVNEYSDTVLREIHKNHEEALFLYDMLNSKHANLKETVSKVNQTVKEVEEAQNMVQEPGGEKVLSVEEKEAMSEKEFTTILGISKEVEQEEGNIKVVPPEESQEHNNNDRIMELYKLGKSNVDIAKELGLGVGEVKLVIDLFKTHKART